VHASVGGTPDRKDLTSWPRVHFCHVPKTAGSSLGAWLRSVYPRPLVLPVMLLVDLARLGADEIRRYRCFTGHFGTALDGLIDPPLPAVTLLRDPLERCLSLLRFVARREPRLEVPPSQRRQSELVRRCGGDLDACLAEPEIRRMLWNGQARFLTAPIDLRPCLGRPLPEVLAYLEELDRRPHPELAGLGAAARARLDAMLVVGTVERFEASADAIVRALGLPRPYRWPRENLAPERAGAIEGFRWATARISDRAREALWELTAVDREIHAHAGALLERRLAEEAAAREARAARSGARAAAPGEVSAAGGWRERWETDVPPALALAYLATAAQGAAITARPGAWLGLVAALAGWNALSRTRPVRALEAHGLAGLLAEVALARVAPAAAALAVAGGAGVAALSPAACAAGLVWIGAWAVRSGASRQLASRWSDLVAGRWTLAARHPAAVVRRRVVRMVLPVELAALGIALALAPSPWAFGALAAYGLTELGRSRRHGFRFAAVRPRRRFPLLLAELYEVLLPLALLVGQALRFGADGAALAIHALLFPRRAAAFARSALRLAVRASVRRGRSAP
jgi:hypothetical protein